jgi:uncharacterized membrane protein
MKTKKRMFIITLLAGAGLLASGIIAEHFYGESRYFMFAVGFGIGILTVAAVNTSRMKKRPEARREEEISEKDERLIQIRGRAAQTGFFISLFAMAAAGAIFLFMDNITACFIIIALLLLHAASYLALLGYYGKRM